MITPGVEFRSRSFAERLGGRWAVSVAGYLTTFTIALLGLLSTFDRLDRRGATLLFVALVAAYALNAVIDVALHRTRWSDRGVRPVPVGEVLARLTFSGLCIATAFTIVRDVLDVDLPFGLLRGFTVYPLLAVWVGSGVIVWLDVIDQARDLRGRAIVERSSSSEVRERADEVVRELRRRVQATVTPELDRLRSVAASASPTEPSVGVVSEIRSSVERTVRSTGRDLWERAGVPARIGPMELLREVLANPTFRPWSIITLSIVLSVAEGAGAGWIESSVAAAASVLVFVECRVANALMRRSAGLRPVIAGVTIVVFAGQSIVVDRSAGLWGGVPDQPGIAVVLFLTVTLVAVTSAIGSYRNLDDRRAVALASMIRSDRLDAAAQAHVVSEEARRLAALLHGKVQSRLLGCAMALEFAGEDPGAIRTALDRTLAVLSDEWAMEGHPSAAPLAEVVAAWVGLCDVRVHGVDVIPPDAVDDAAVVIEELIANAVRHGRAGRVTVAIDARSDGLEITAVDDGTGGAHPGRPGLGSSVLARAGSVDRRPGPTGWSVTVRIPI
ncbi:MAG: sensor histidine kinase [Ilumatobacteraceae bacterium]